MYINTVAGRSWNMVKSMDWKHQTGRKIYLRELKIGKTEFRFSKTTEGNCQEKKERGKETTQAK
jgi:hypothetical protein